MFVNEEHKVEILANLDETLICATHRTQDLIPVFLEAIKNTVEYEQLITAPYGPILSYIQEDVDSHHSESTDCHFLMLELFEILDRYAPDGYYFGAHMGDGSDYGYWKFEDEE